MNQNLLRLNESIVAVKEKKKRIQILSSHFSTWQNLLKKILRKDKY